MSNSSNNVTVGQILSMVDGKPSTESLDSILDLFQTGLEESFPKGRLINSEVDGESVVRVESGHELSGTYLLSIVPELRLDNGDPEFNLTVRLDRTNDGAGMGSKSWDIVDEESIGTEASSTLSEVFAKAQGAAAEIHADLMDSVGIPRDTALEMAKKLWVTEE